MKFPTKFSRYKGTAPAGSIALGADVFPVDVNSAPRKPAATDDNVLFARAYSKNGFPTKRVVLAGAYFATSAHSPPALNVSGYIWDDNLGFWIKLAASATSITPGDTTSSPVVGGSPVYFEVPALTDSAPTQAALNGGTDPGSLAVLFLISDNTASNGRYDFVAAPVLNEKSV